MIPFTSVHAAISWANWHFDGECSVRVYYHSGPVVLARIDRFTFNDQFIEVREMKPKRPVPPISLPPEWINDELLGEDWQPNEDDLEFPKKKEDKT